MDRDEDIPLPNKHDVQQGNERTFETLQSFKTSIVPKYKGGDTHGFVRRRLARLLYKQTHANVYDEDDTTIDEYIDHEMGLLRRKDTGNDKSRTDELYIECLIRSQFNHEQAYQLLINNRPHLVK